MLFQRIYKKAPFVCAVLLFAITALQALILFDLLTFYGTQVIDIDFILTLLLPLIFGIAVLTRKPLPALIALVAYFFHKPLEIICSSIYWLCKMIECNSSTVNPSINGYPVSEFILTIAEIVFTAFAYAALVIIAACNTFKCGERFRNTVNRFWFIPAIVLAIYPIYSLILALNSEYFWITVSNAMVARHISDITLPIALAFYGLYFASYRKYDGGKCLVNKEETL